MTREKLVQVAVVLTAAALIPAAGTEAHAQERMKRLDLARILEQFDANKDGLLDRAEVPPKMRTRFDQMDADKDGKLSLEELNKYAGTGDKNGLATDALVDPLLQALDTNGDGELSEAEIRGAAAALSKLDKNGNDQLDRDELANLSRRRGGGKPGEVITPAAKGERIAEKLKVGDVAPDFTLPLVDGKAKITLSSFQDKKPVVLIFASYT